MGCCVAEYNKAGLFASLLPGSALAAALVLVESLVDMLVLMLPASYAPIADKPSPFCSSTS